MAKLAIKRSSTSKLVRVFIQDSSSTTGAGLTGLAFGTSGLTAYYIREGDASATAMTLITMTVGTWASLGFKEVDATNLPGVYELGLPNAALSSGNSTLVMLKGATNMAPCLLEIELDAYDPQDAVRLGLTAMPNANAGANGGLPTGNGSGQVSLNLAQAVATSNTAETIGDALNAARAQGFGKWALSGTTLNLYANDGTTVVRAFTLDSATTPTSRT